MTNVAFQRNIGSFILALAGLASTSVTAGGSNDATALTGLTIDRNQIDQVVLSGAFVVNFNPTLGANKNVGVTCTFEDSADGTNWDVYDGGPGTRGVETILDSGERAVAFKCQLGGARRYVRARPKFDASALNTDTVAVHGAVWIIGGSDALPMTISEALEGISG